jgi:hypothetical protein
VGPIATSAARMRRLELFPEPARGDAASGIAFQSKCIGDGSAEEGIAQCGEYQPGRGFADMMLLVAHAELGDEHADRFKDRVERIAVPGKDHPRCERARAFTIEGIERPVDDFTSVRLMRSGAPNRLRDSVSHAVRDGPGKLGLQACCRAEMMKEVRMRAPDFCRDRLQRHRLRTLF